MSRVITHLKRDISAYTRYHQDVSDRLCFMLGARKAIKIMKAVKHAPEYIFIKLHLTEKHKKYKDVKKLVKQEIEIQGYSYTILEHLENTIAVKTTNRKDIPNDDEEDVENKFKPSPNKLREMATVIVKREASISASLGGSLMSSDIIQKNNVKGKQEVLIQNLHYEVVAHGIAEMSSDEIDRSPGRVAIRTTEGIYDIFQPNEQRRYKQGLYSLTTLPRILGIQILKFRPNTPANVIVICPDDGEVAISLFKNSPEGSIFNILIENEEHKERILKSLERVNLSLENFNFIAESLVKYSKSRPRDKATHCYIEFNSSNSGFRPNPFFDLEEGTLINHARTQFQGVRALSLLCKNMAKIAYVTHSIDPAEGQEIIVQNFRQGNFAHITLEEELLEKYKMPLLVIPEIHTITGTKEVKSKLPEERYTSCWLGVDPENHKSHGGFVAKFEFLAIRPGR